MLLTKPMTTAMSSAPILANRIREYNRIVTAKKARGTNAPMKP